MPRTPCRPPNVGDLMILTAATAVGLWWMGPPGWPGTLADFLGWSYQRTTPLTAAWMIALVAVRLRRPRPHWRRIGRQPGFVACAALAASVVTSYTLSRFSLAMRQPMPDQLFESWHRMGVSRAWDDAVLAGFATVPAAWFVLAASRRWSAEPGWIDRLGRLLGACWASGILLFLAMVWIRPLLSRIGGWWS